MSATVEGEYEFYAGDGVYVCFDRSGTSVVLYTSDGISVTNKVVLEPSVLYSFERWLESLKASLRQEAGGSK